MTYDKAHFIARFRGASERECLHPYDNAQILWSREDVALADLLTSKVWGYYNAIRIVKGEHPNYQQPTAKERILAALHDCI